MESAYTVPLITKMLNRFLIPLGGRDQWWLDSYIQTDRYENYLTLQKYKVYATEKHIGHFLLADENAF